ncbi:hypothetical protein OIE66_34630 [Nonomuraea sp. NBC_01738]|uniref:hypothetical protein n=1 Tax=Nonomuraea sp. NBC_01738 TaxID=2976003 RepID=UPI002E12F7C5|nr:hypothetical protein OIE66_34630 [Nonomuraea sp. NBC_01738]
MALRRETYERYQPVFWRRAAGATESHTAFLTKLVASESVLCLVSEDDGVMTGFAVATLVPSPPVYDPGGLTCTLDDFAVTSDSAWTTTGLALLRAICAEAAARGAAQVVVVCAHEDEAKRQALRLAGLTIASEWWTAPLDQPTNTAV